MNVTENGSVVVPGVELAKPKPTLMARKKVVKTTQDPVEKAKQLVVDNYNKHHNPRKTPPLSLDHMNVISFAKTMEGWKAFIISPMLRGILYEVTYNASGQYYYLDVYMKRNNVRIKEQEPR